MFGFKKIAMPSAKDALPGRGHEIRTAAEHFVNRRPLKGPYPAGTEKALFGLGCFWGAEKKFWELGDGIIVTAVGYAGGLTPNPIYEEVCSGRTGHNEVVLVVYDPKKISYETLLKTFWESHDPTQGMRQGNDVGTQYRSGIYPFTPEQSQAAEASKAMYEAELKKKGYGPSPPRSSMRRRSISPRTITSSIWPRTRSAIAGSAVPACRVRSAPAPSWRRRSPRFLYLPLKGEVDRQRVGAKRRPMTGFAVGWRGRTESGTPA